MTKRVSVITIFLLLLNCSPNEQIQPFERTRVLMDTFVQIFIYDQNRSVEELEQIVNLAFKRIEEIERITNNYDDSSFISIINREAGDRAIILDAVMYDLITKSDQINKISDGAFDITIESVKRLWNFSDDHPQIPGDSLLKYQLQWVGAEHIKIKDKKLRFNSPESKIDLGAIAKGYAIDQSIQVLKENGITDAMVNGGGDLRTICSDLTSGKRRVWIKHPRQSGVLFGYFRMDEGSIATSGDYERFFIYDSIRYHHILDPKTGYPARECVSVTIQALTATEADGLATAVFVLGIDRGLELIERLPDVEGIIIFERDGKLDWKASSGLKKKFKTS
ncbi:MAG: FAD:protein FMN transferase [bacterium]|nr:MAG: FAD:protein FMN transferase [bacterium]